MVYPISKKHWEKRKNFHEKYANQKSGLPVGFFDFDFLVQTLLKKQIKIVFQGSRQMGDFKQNNVFEKKEVIKTHQRSPDI